MLSKGEVLSQGSSWKTLPYASTFPSGLHALLNKQPISTPLLATGSPYDSVEADADVWQKVSQRGTIFH